MAKHVGNYHYLNGGMASWALETLTGHYTCVFLLERRVRVGGAAVAGAWARARAGGVRVARETKG
mgnify:CR=1 FL=1